MDVHKIRTVRLYLQSRKMVGSDDDDDDLPSAFDLNQEGSKLENQSLVSQNQDGWPSDTTHAMQSLVSQAQERPLIGSTLESLFFPATKKACCLALLWKGSLFHLKVKKAR